MKRTRSFLLLLLSLMALLGSVTAWALQRDTRQDRLNHDLLTAIQNFDDAAALRALQQGADMQAQERHAPYFPDRVGRDTALPPPAPSLLVRVMEISGRHFPSQHYSPSLPLIQALMERGADPKERDPDAGDSQGVSPLMLAVVYNRPDLIRLMIAHGGNPEDTDEADKMSLLAFDRHPGGGLSYLSTGFSLGRGPTLLMCAAKYAPKCVPTLLAAGAQVNAQDGKGETALLLAVESGNVECVKQLLDHHADWRLKDRMGETPLQMARASLGYNQAHGSKQDILPVQQIIHLLQQAGAKE